MLMMSLGSQTHPAHDVHLQAQRLRQQALQIVADQVDADAAVFFDAREVDGTVYFGDSESLGCETIKAHLDGMRDEPVPQLIETIIRGPLPEDRDEFLNLYHRLDLRRLDLPEPDSLPWSDRFALADWTGLLVYHGARFIGWIGAWRLQQGEPFTPTECERLNETVDDVRPLLVEAFEHVLNHRSHRPGFLLFTDETRCSHASPGFQRWLDSRRRQDLVTLLGSPPPTEPVGPFFLAGMGINVIPLESPGGRRHFLLRLVPAQFPKIEPDVVLTPTQKTVARLATTGATVEEMASMLHRSPHTVKTHLKHIYRRLDISSRVELVELFGVS